MLNLLVGVGKVEIAFTVVRELFDHLQVYFDGLLEIVVRVELLRFVQ